MRTADNRTYVPFTVEVVPRRDTVTVHLTGELDLLSADAVRDSVSELRKTGFDEIVVDLRDVDFIDSMGLRTLLALSDEAKHTGQRLTLMGPRSPAWRIFDVTATRDLFEWRRADGALG